VVPEEPVIPEEPVVPEEPIVPEEPVVKKKPAAKKKPAKKEEPVEIEVPETPLDIDLGEDVASLTVGKLDLDIPDIEDVDLLEPVVRKRASRKSVKKDPDDPPAEELTLF